MAIRFYPEYPSVMTDFIRTPYANRVESIAYDWLHRLMVDVSKGNTLLIRTGDSYFEWHPSFQSRIRIVRMLPTGNIKPIPEHNHTSLTAVRTCLKRHLGFTADPSLYWYALGILRFIAHERERGSAFYIFSKDEKHVYPIYDSRLICDMETVQN